MRRPIISPWGHRQNMLWSLRQQEPIQIRRPLDEIPKPHSFKSQVRSTFKNVCHAGAKDTRTDTFGCSRFVPLKRFPPMGVSKKTAGSAFTPNVVPNAFGPGLCVTVVTSRRDLVASPPRVEGVICP